MKTVVVHFVVLLLFPGIYASPVEFVRDVQPIFERHCYDCHGPDKQKSGLRLDVRSAALKGGEYEGPNILPGKAGESNLVHFVRGDHEEIRMPPKGDLISKAELNTLIAWIDQGAVWPEGVDLVKLKDPKDHWAFHPITKPKPPTPANQTRVRGEIDEFVFSRLESEGLSPNPDAEKRVWLRRVYFDLTGLAPAPGQLERFINDTSPNAFEKVVDELLAAPRYGERWAQHWLDVVRYADTHGFEVNTPRPNAWPYRDYVIEAFNNDTPYDQFIREQIAGDTYGKDAATGFLVTAAALLPGQIGKDAASKRLARQDELSEIVTNVGEAFLGLSIGCARCHDHKFDPVSAKDFYSMQAFFSGVEYGERTIRNKKVDGVALQLKTIETDLSKLIIPVGSDQLRPPVSTRLNIEKFEPVMAKKVRFMVLATMVDNRREPCIDELEVFDVSGRNIALAGSGVSVEATGSKTQINRHELRFLNDGLYGNSRSWMSSQAGKGWVQLEFPTAHRIDRIHWGRDRLSKFGDRLPVNYRIEADDGSGEWQTIADSSDRKPFDLKNVKADIFTPESFPEAHNERVTELIEKRKQLLGDKELYPDGRQVIFAGKFKTPEPMHLLLRGDPEQPKEEVAPAIIDFLADVKLAKTTSDRERRLALANWIASPNNPLTARVIVNRIWQWHFGIGLVETANDFGNSGVAPTHPQLLDWLATDFIESGWSIKKLHRKIVLSSTYRQSNQCNEVGLAKDGDCRLLWRFPSRRLEAEAIRDTILLVSDRLNLKTGGPGFDLFNSRGGLNGFKPVESFKNDGLRRLIYAHKIRMERDAVFGAFDCPDAGQSAPRRNQSTTPIQALNLFNSRYTIEQARGFAKKIINQTGMDVPAQVQLAWQLAYSRNPDPEELRDAETLIKQYDLPTLCRAIFNSNEFVFLP